MVYNADCRNNNLDPDSTVGKGYITEILVAKFLGIKTCFDITGNFNHRAFDMYEHEHFGRINVKSSILKHDKNYLKWCFVVDKNIVPNFFFCIGYDEYRTHIESVYIIPNGDDVRKLVGISIPKDGHSKWDVFKESEEEVKKWNVFKESEEEVKKWDELFHTLKLENCPVLRKIGSKKALERKKIRAYKERMREKYKRDVLKISNNG